AELLRLGGAEHPQGHTDEAERDRAAPDRACHAVVVPPFCRRESRACLSFGPARYVWVQRRMNAVPKASPPNGGLASRPATSRPRHVYGRGKSLWKLWKRAAQALISSGSQRLGRLCGNAHAAVAAGLRPKPLRISPATPPMPLQ